MPLAPEDIQSLQQLLTEGRAREAEPLARAAVKTAPDDAHAWFLLASAMRATQQPQEALAAIQRALLNQPFHPGFHTFKAELHLDAGQHSQAEESLRHALDAKKDFLPALSLLGIHQLDRGRVEESIATLLQCVNLKPDSGKHFNNLGAALLAAGREAEAERAFAQSVRLDPEYFTARYNLVRSLIKRGADQDAVIQLQVLLEQQPEHQECLFLVGNLCHRNGDFATAADYLRRAASMQPVNPTIVNAFAEFCWEQGDNRTAIELYTIAAQNDPANIRSALGRHLCLPMVAESLAAQQSARVDYAAGLRALKAELPMLRQRPAAALLREIQWTNFLLAYQGEDDRLLQSQYAEWVTELMHQALPQYATGRNTARREGKIRVGFLSGHLHECTVGRYFASWITGLPRAEFDVHVYSTGNVHDALSQRLAEGSQWKRLTGQELGRIADTVFADDLDILIYPELGMNPQIFPLAALRLARRQLCGWGHPVTTGFAAIDGFLSCASMEPADAAQHYSEKLHQLPGLGTAYTPTAGPAVSASRAQHGLPESGALYLVPQSLYKIHPDNDAVIADLLARDPQGTVVMFATDRHKVATGVFVRRLQAALQSRGVDPQGRVRILPQTDHATYLAIISLCDVMVDTLHWSGGNTSLDALSVGLPIVTVEGRFMRGRQSAAMLRMVGVPELVCANAEALATMAIKLAQDADQRNRLAARIREGHRQLFNQAEPLKALRELLLSTAG